VPVALQLARYVGADVAAADDDDAHQPSPPDGGDARTASKRSSASPATATQITSPSCSKSSGVGTRALPSLPRAATRMAPATSTRETGRPAQLGGTARSTRHALADGSIHSTPEVSG